jgi:hypothetical protein
MTSPACGAEVTYATGERLAGPCVLPVHHSFFHLWIDEREYSWHWNGPSRQVMGDAAAEEPARIQILPPGWIADPSDLAGTATRVAGGRRVVE